MFIKHANTFFPGDLVRRKGEKTAGPTGRIGGSSSLDGDKLEVDWPDGSTTYEEPGMLESVSQ